MDDSLRIIPFVLDGLDNYSMLMLYSKTKHLVVPGKPLNKVASEKCLLLATVLHNSIQN